MTKRHGGQGARQGNVARVAWAALIGMAVLGVAASAPALIITGGPTYSLPGGGSCTVTPGTVTTTGTGATVSCTGVNLGAHSNVYFGVRVDQSVNGNTMTGAAPAAAQRFRFSTSDANSITYTSQTSVTSLSGLGSPTVTSTLRITRTSGTATVVATGGNPGNHGTNGDVERLFRLTSGSSFTFDVDILASATGIGSGQACPAVYDLAHASAGAGGERSRVDVGFYYSDCGDGMVDSPEQCDDGAANGTAASCCSSTCTFKTNGTACTDDGNPCTLDQCNGASAVCQHPAGNAGAVCRAAAGDCDLAETCTGSSATCPSDVKSTAECRASAGACDLAEFCNGSSNTCPSDAKSTSVCRASAGGCDIAEICDGVTNDCPGDVLVGAGIECRAAAGDCDVAEVCDGSSPACPTDTFVANTTVCRAAAGTCDVAEHCTGSSATCPADTKSTALCRAAAGVCDLAESCDGVNDDCPADAKSTATCRAAAGTCDVAELCDGSSDDCPADDIRPAGFVCNAGSGDACDPDETCDGVTTDCPADTITTAGTVCRAGSGDSCDPDEVCSGVADEPCPADVVESSSTVCRPGSGDLCDPDEFCPGVPGGTCAADVVAPAGTVCDPGSGDLCDPDETCSGVAGEACPADTVASAGTVCRAAAGSCDVAESCSGTADVACPADDKVPNGTVCRSATGVCDITETCDGVTPDCPADAVEPDGTDCGDGLFCNGDETCSAGSCVTGAAPCAFVCDEGADMCLSAVCPDAPQACRTAQKSILLIKNKVFNDKDKLIWKWIKGAETTTTDFADPRTAADYALCLYGGTANALIAEVHIPASNSKWAATGTKGYKYKDSTLAADGVQKVILKSGAAGKAKALLKGKGSNLPDPLDLGPLGTPVTAQLLNYQSGVCWGSTFTTAKKDDTAIFKAKSQ